MEGMTRLILQGTENILLVILMGLKSYACNCPVYKSLDRIQLSELERSECIFIGEVLSIDRTAPSVWVCEASNALI